MERSAGESNLRGLGIAGAAVAGVLLIVAIAAVGANFSATSGGGFQPTQPPLAGAATPSFALDVTPTPEVTMVAGFIRFGEGTYRVGAEIPPGTYRAPDASDRCYWERIGPGTATTTNVIANSGLMNGPAAVTIDPGDTMFNSTNCGTWTNDLSQVTESGTSFGDGTYIVGTDVQPGRYTSLGGESCYWARLSGFEGTLDQVLENNFGDSPATVTIAADDRGVLSTNCGIWARV